MKPPLLQIVLDEPTGAFRCGAEIRGRVDVTVHEACEGRKLVVAVAYRGSGNAPTQTIRSARDKETQQLFVGAWTPGTYSYPFRLPAPEACDYAGTIMTIGWYLRAGVGVRVATSFDAESEDEQAIDLAPAELSPEDQERYKTSEVVRRDPAPIKRGCLLSSIALVLIGCVLAWLGLESGAALPGVVAAVMGLAFLGIMLRQALVNRKIAWTELRVGSVVAWPGAVVPCSLVLEAKAPLEVTSATLTLEGWEHVKKFTGLYRSTGPVNQHMVLAEEKALALPAPTLPAGVPVHLSGELVFPSNATPTMDFDNELKFLWRAVLRIKIKGSPDWFDVQPITVLPRSPGAAGGRSGRGRPRPA
jgi:hypothetical protein